MDPFFPTQARHGETPPNGSRAQPRNGALHDVSAGPGPRPVPAWRVLRVNLAAIPPEMVHERRWVVWKLEIRHGQRTKVPYQ